ncbi:hypothetical protein PHYSODRAFT_329229 [Phytophthora sojae]|uniref:Uncharacterized protein n=1 Tax=Phytophthora sojae (strain P6497) TaxID=1094619 RepID=G4ZB19_PHYSP|nr:hypothetical protein PHYSODRAFT_329229 [Phytophthora sojae]EGZ21238.1 hypothetical protein PHYSODRAFT_329229 [Phytophthora sojae]|eukprot:XP_009523955.1 hypothetical protein PHYSODRAFT_329229 [Phytophthora sojae]
MPRTVGAKDISPKVRVAVVVYLTTLSKECRLRYGTIVRAKRLFKLSHAAIETIWGLRGDPAALVQPRRPYPPKPTRISPKEVGERVAAVPLCQRQTLRLLEAASGIPRSGTSSPRSCGASYQGSADAYGRTQASAADVGSCPSAASNR